MIALAYLFIPIAIIVVFSFNEPPGSLQLRPGVVSALMPGVSVPGRRPRQNGFLLSLRLAALATVIAVVLGTAMSLGAGEVSLQGQGLGQHAARAAADDARDRVGLFAADAVRCNQHVDRGFLTIVIAHVMFCVSYVATTVKARIRGFDWRLEEAAADLGATPLRTFLKVTFPIIAPGVFAAASADVRAEPRRLRHHLPERGHEPDLPDQRLVTKRSTIPPQINVFGTFVLLVSAAIAIAGLMVQRRRDRVVG